MPIYEYMCDECGHIFEELRKYSAESSGRDKIECPHECGKTASKLPSAHGGYSMSSGGSSTRPKRAGSFKRTK